jgi:hypothetical protein
MKHPFQSYLTSQRTLLLAGLSCLILGLATLSLLFLADRALRKSEPAAMARARVAETYGKLPLMFQANAGQTDERVKFMAQGPGYSLFLTSTESVFVMSRREKESKESRWKEPDSERALKAPRPAEQAVLRMKLVDANAEATVTGTDEMATKVSYFGGNDPTKWHAAVPTFGRVRYSEIYPGIDLVYYGNQRQLEYDFVVAPGADCTRISLAFEGADKVEVEETSGDLLLDTSLGTLRQHRPQVYQEADGARRSIPGRYVKRAGGLIGFEVAGYDPTKRLVIDPTLVYSTYLGGSGAGQGSGVGGDSSTDIAVDASGNAYITGSTNSPDFPVTSGALQTTYPGSYCDYVTKLNPSGTALVYSTYLGSNGAFSIAVDASGNAYITGVTNSASFSTTPGAYQTTNHAGSLGNAFITKLNPSGTALVYSTYLGGTGDSDRSRITGGDIGTGIAVDSSGNASVVGFTYSKDFPVTPGAFQATNKANNSLSRYTCFVTRLNSTGTALVYSTYLGGTDHEFSSRIAVDASGNAYVTGSTGSTDFPTTAGAFQTTFPGFSSGFATKLNPTGTALIYSTYLGGSAFGSTRSRAIAIDASGNAYLAGQTFSTNYPTTFGSLRKNYCGGFDDAFVTKLSADGSSLVYSTYLCGSGNNADDAFGIAVDSAGNAYVTGYTTSDTFPTTADAYATQRAGGEDAFLTKINPAGSALVYSTFLGGAGSDDVSGIAVDNAGHAYVAGVTDSANLPTTPGAFQTSYHGGNDVFVAKFDFSATAPTGRLLNISTRLRVLPDPNALIGGFIITGANSKKVVVRGEGPSLPVGVLLLADPVLELHDASGTIATNNNWKINDQTGLSQEAEVRATGLAPVSDFESVIIATLSANGAGYTAVLRGNNGGTGVGLVEVYDLSGGAAESSLGNISTRGFVDTGDNVMIGGFIAGPATSGNFRVLVLAVGPSMPVSGTLQDPTLALHDGNGNKITSNDDWKIDESTGQSQEAAIRATGMTPGDDRESALVQTLIPGAYTVIVRGKGNTTGVGAVQIYNLP